MRYDFGALIIEEHFDSGEEQRARIVKLRDGGMKIFSKFTTSISGRMIWCVSYPYA